LARGQPTFMVEMSETANILNNASPLAQQPDLLLA
jgi:DNA mismatch repair ATPase MutS